MIDCTFEDGNHANLRHVTVDTLVLKDDKLLLVKRAASLLEGGKWALAGGFVDRDETTTQAVAREVREETGWEVKDITLFRINDSPNRPHEDRQNISLIYTCTAIEKIGESDWETDDAQWFGLTSMPPADQIAFDHADSIRLYQIHIKQPYTLPILGKG